MTLSRGDWTPDDQAEFEARLVRAQASRRVQDLCRKGEAALAGGEPDQALARFIEAEGAAGPSAQVVVALTGQGRALAVLGETAAALAAYDRAVARMRTHPSFETEAWLELAELAAREGLADRRAMALGLLRTFGAGAEGEIARRVAAVRAAFQAWS